MMTRTLIVAAIAAGALAGCEQPTEEVALGSLVAPKAQPVSAPTVTSAPIAAEAPQRAPAAAPTALALTGSTSTTSSTNTIKSHPGCDFNSPRADALRTESPWMGAQDGSMWNGTGHPDPEPLRKISDSEMLQRAMKAGDKSPDRWHALVSVGRRKVPGAVDALAGALAASEDVTVREMGVTGSIEHGGPEVLPLLREALVSDKDPHIRGLSIWALAAWGPTEAGKAIELGLKDDDVGVQGMAILAVWAIKDETTRAMSILAEAARSPDERIYQEAANVLMRLQRAEAGELLIATASSSKGDENKRKNFAWAYKQWRKSTAHLCGG